MDARHCSVDGCERPVYAKNWCNTHYNRVRKHGSPGTAQIEERDSDSYQAVHYRLKKLFGPANEQMCVDCGKRAMDWSYNNTGKDERTCQWWWADTPTGVYSTDVEQYSPRCRKCHKAFDRQQKVA